MTERKFYKTIITFEVLSEEPIPMDMEVQNIIDEAIEGGYSMSDAGMSAIEMDGKQAAKELIEQASSPEFFRIDENGNDIDDLENNTFGS